MTEANENESEADTELFKNSIPYDASPEYVSEISKELSEGGLTLDEIANRVGYSSDLVSRNLSYGVELGFFRETGGGGYTLTDKATSLGYIELSSLDWLFQEALDEYPFYRRLLRMAFEEGIVEQVKGNDVFPQESLIGLVLESFNLDISNRVATGAVRSFMRTLDAADIGRYVRGDGEYPTRVVLNEGAYEYDTSSRSSSDSTSRDDDDGQENEEHEEPSTDHSDRVMSQNGVFDEGAHNTGVAVNVEITEETDSQKLADKVIEFQKELCRKATGEGDE